VLELKAVHHLRAEEIERIEIAIFDVAYHIIGGGEEGDQYLVHSKEEADHSLPYMVAVALLDDEVTPAQYTPERIRREDVQSLLRKVIVRPDDEMSSRFPAEMACRIKLFLKGKGEDQALSIEKRDYEGFYTRPMSWERAVAKFEQLAAPYAGKTLCGEIAEAVAHLDTIDVAQLTALLARVNRSKQS
jgi:2-methylcitrate dehydratase